jgi:hypothetical protein
MIWVLHRLLIGKEGSRSYDPRLNFIKLTIPTSHHALTFSDNHHRVGDAAFSLYRFHHNGTGFLVVALSAPQYCIFPFNKPMESKYTLLKLGLSAGRTIASVLP